MKLNKRPIFLADVAECADYLCTEAGEDVAQRWKQALDRTLSLLGKFPELGRLRRDLPYPGVRSFFLKEFPRYLIFYRIEQHSLDLLRIRHGMMHLPGLFETPGGES
jgi:toxin ParE1/3/4